MRGCLALLLAIFATSPILGQTRLMPLGDSITQGGQDFVSYRYELWFDLQDAGYVVDFVGGRDFINSGTPDPALYPEYLTTFDRDHEGWWGRRTDEIADLILAAANAALPDIVLLHLGTNDIGQQASAGVTNAQSNLPLIVERLRQANPDVTIVMAQVIPIGPGSSYFANADQVAPLNAAISAIAAQLSTAQSPIVLVDAGAGFDLATMMQADGLHPNALGEAHIAAIWQAALEPLLPDNPPPAVAITAPADESSFVAPTTIAIEADASDDGSVVSVEFFAGALSLGSDTTAPYSVDWIDPPVGNHTLTALAEDDEGATRTSEPVGIGVLPPGSGTPIAIANASFELPLLADTALADGPGIVGDWLFSATPNTYLGIFNPPAGSYPEAAGSGTPIGADGTNAAFLFNVGGAGETVEATQLLSETLQPGFEYVLTVAIGRFLPDQPYVFSTWGGYTIELLAGGSVIASDSGSVDPPVAEFRNAVAVVSSASLPQTLIGEPLGIRLTLPTEAAPRSTHFDDVRLVRSADPSAGRVGSLFVERQGDDLRLDWNPSCAGDDYAIYEGALGPGLDHTPLLCSTSGSTTSTVTPGSGDRYYLVVPRSASREGSHGTDSSGNERTAGAAPCLTQRIVSCP